MPPPPVCGAAGYDGACEEPGCACEELGGACEEPGGAYVNEADAPGFGEPDLAGPVLAGLGEREAEDDAFADDEALAPPRGAGADDDEDGVKIAG